jgi:hypothetical protein
MSLRVPIHRDVAISTIEFDKAIVFKGRSKAIASSSFFVLAKTI